MSPDEVRPSYPLEPGRETTDQWLREAGQYVCDHITSLSSMPAAGPIGPQGIEVAKTVSQVIGEKPLEGGLTRALGIIHRAATASLTTSGPGYLAYTPGGGLFASVIADLIACGINRYTGVADAAPALVRLETDVLAFLACSFGYSDDARGLFTSGGSIANLAATVTARYEHLGDSGDLRRAMVYTSSQAHHSVLKAARLAGIPPDNIRTLAVDAEFRLDPVSLSQAIDNDHAEGLQPFLVIATAGTTNTGAIDPLERIAEICAEQHVWLHVDAAYGGAFVLCDEGCRKLAGIERADSIVLDPHKGLFLPFGTGCLLVREGDKLRHAHHHTAEYLQDFKALDRAGMPPSPCEYGPELSRDYRGLRVWLPLMLHGAAAFRAALAEKLSLAARVEDGLKERIHRGNPIEIVSPRQLSIVAFRLRRHDHETLVAWNERNTRWLAAVNKRGRVFLSSTLLPVVDGNATTLRVCVLSHRTHAERVDACLEDLDAALKETTCI